MFAFFRECHTLIHIGVVRIVSSIQRVWLPIVVMPNTIANNVITSMAQLNIPNLTPKSVTGVDFPASRSSFISRMSFMTRMLVADMPMGIDVYIAVRLIDSVSA